MRQVTGSNPSPSANRMSIQLTLSGHSFSRSDLPRLSSRDERMVDIEVITDRTILVPADLLNEQHAEQLFSIAGITPREDEQIIVVRDDKSGIAALMALPDTLLATLADRYGRRYELTTPLLRTRLCTEPTVWLYLAAGIIYIKVWSGGKLRLAEAFPYKKEEDILYYASVLDKQFVLNNFCIVVDGTTSSSIKTSDCVKLLKKYYKKVICE